MVDHELLARKPVVSLRATEGEFPCPVENEPVRGEARSHSLQSSALQLHHNLLEDRKQDPVLPLVRKLREVLDAQNEPAPLDPGFARRHPQRGEDLEIRSEHGGEIRIAPQPCEEATAEFSGDPMSHRQVVVRSSPQA